MRRNKEDLGKLVENLTGKSDEKLTFRMEKVLKECKDLGVSDWKIVKNRVLGVAFKLRVHCFGEVGERLEKLVNHLFLVGKDLELVCGVLRILLNISGEIYRDFRELEPSIEENQNYLYDYKEEEDDERSNIWSQYTQTSIYSQVENSISTLTPNFKISPKFEGILSTPDLPQLLTPDISLLFTNNGLLNKIKLGLNQSLKEPPQYPNLYTSTNQLPDPTENKLSEYSLVYEVLTMLLNINSQVFTRSSKKYTINQVHLSHLTQETLINMLEYFVNLNNSYTEIKTWTEVNKVKEAKVIRSFCLAVNLRIEKFEGKVLECIGNLLNKAGIPLTLIRLKCEFYYFSEEFEVLSTLIASIPDGPEAYQCSELLSTLYKFSEFCFIEHNFIQSLFFSTFSQYVSELCLWMTSGYTNSESLITKIISGKFEWESYSVRITKIGQKLVKCVPVFLVNDCKKILAIGNYQFLYNKINDLGLNFESILGVSKLSENILNSLQQSFENLEYCNSVKNSIRSSFSLKINTVYLAVGTELCKIFKENFGIMKTLNALQRIFLLQDPNFLRELAPVLQCFRERRPFEHLSHKLNKFFSESKYKDLCYCQESILTLKISEIKIFFKFPEIFSFVLSDTLNTYQQIFYFLLEIKLASGSIKTINKEYDCILQRVQFIHFMDCFEFYAGQSVVTSTLLQFNSLEIDEIYELKKSHKRFLTVLSKKLFIEGDLTIFYEKILKIFECFNTIFYLNFVGARFELRDFFQVFWENLKFVLDSLESNRNQFFAEEYLIADLMIGFNKFYV